MTNTVTNKNVGINGFHGFTASWDEHPDRDEEWKKVEVGRIGEERFRREYGCEFLVYDETLINSIKFASMKVLILWRIWDKHVGIKNLILNQLTVLALRSVNGYRW